MITDARTAAQIDLLERTSPGAIELATYASLAVFIEPELLRALRLRVARHLDVSAEADLWLSRLVRASGPTGVVMRPEVARALQERLAQRTHPDVIDEAWRIIEATHADTSPAIFLEESLARHSIRGTSDEIDEGLGKALNTMRADPGRGLAAWWLRARERLAPKVRKSDFAPALDRTAMLQLDLDPEAAEGAGGEPQARLVQDADTVRLLARRGERGVELGDFEPDALTVALPVPDLEPIRLELTWADGSERSTLALRPNQTELLAVGPGPVRVKTERGEVFELPAFEPRDSAAGLLLMADLIEPLTVAWAEELGSSNDEVLREAARRVVAESIRQYVDPPWRRGLRAMRARFLEPLAQAAADPSVPALETEVLKRAAHAPEELRLSEFARAHAWLGTRTGSMKRVEKLVAGLRPFDDWDPASAEVPEDRSAETELLVEKVFGLDEPITGWLLVHLDPPWHREQRHLLAEGVRSRKAGDLPEFLDDLLARLEKAFRKAAKKRPGDTYSCPAPTSRPAFEHLRLHRPDLHLFPRPHPDGVRLEGSPTEFSRLVRWIRSHALASLRALVDERRAGRSNVEAARGELTVAADGSADFQSIVDALAAVAEGGTVHVKAGTYHEHPELRPGVSLLGDPEGEAIVDGGGTGWVIKAADRCRIARLTIRGSGSESGASDCGVLVEGCRGAVVEDNRIVHNGHYGIVLRECQATVRGNRLASNKVLGIYVDDGVEMTVTGNQFDAHPHSAIDIPFGRPRGVIRNNNLLRARSGIVYGSELHAPLELSIVNNIFWANKQGIACPAPLSTEVGWNLFFNNKLAIQNWEKKRPIEPDPTNLEADPRFVDPEGADFRLRSDSPARGAGKDGEDIGAIPYDPAVENLAEPVDPEEALLDLRLRAQPGRWLAELLSSRGVELEESVARDEYTPHERRYTRARIGEIELALLQVRAWILKEAELASVLGELRFSFADHQIVRLVASPRNKPHSVVLQMLEDWSRETGADVRFVPWAELERLEKLEPSPEAVLQVLGIDVETGDGADPESSEREQRRERPFASPFYLCRVGKKLFEVDVTLSASPSLPPLKVVSEVVEILGALGIRRVCDLGAGYLRHLPVLLEAGFEVTAVEYPELWKQERFARTRDELLEGSAAFRGVITPAEFMTTDQRFDAILLIHVLNVIPDPDERTLILERCADVLSSRGCLFFLSDLLRRAAGDRTDRAPFADGYVLGTRRRRQVFHADLSSSTTSKMFARLGFSRLRGLAKSGHRVAAIYRRLQPD